MAWTFSKRCKKALNEKRIKVSIPLSTRTRLWKALQNFNEIFSRSPDSGYDYQTSTLEELPERIKAELGCRELLAYKETAGGKPVPGNLEDFIMRGNYPPFLFDALELFYDDINEENKNPFQRRFNEIMEENNLPWRMADGKIFPIDSVYIEEIILRKAYSLLHEVRFQGALQEFEKARADLSNGDFEGAIQNANLALESVIKEILGVSKAKPGELFRKLIDSELIPEYYNGFLKAFEENILRCVSIMRNEEPSVGHGRGPQDRSISPYLAELGVHLSAVIINFLIKHHLDKIGNLSEKEEIIKDDDIPF